MEEPDDLGLGRPEVGALNLGLRPDTIHGPLAQKRWRSTPFQILDVELFRKLLLTPNSYGPKSGGVGKVMKLYFQPYIVLLKRTPYVTVASFLVQIVSGIREGNEVQVEDESDFNVYASDAAMSSSDTTASAATSLTSA